MRATTRSLRPRTHATYVDDSDAESETEVVRPRSFYAPGPKPTLPRRRPRPRRSTVPHATLNSTSSTSPLTSPSQTSQLPAYSVHTDPPEVPAVLASPDSTSARREWIEIALRVPHHLLPSELHPLEVESGESWIPFLQAWKEGSVTEFSRFAHDVADMVSPSPSEPSAERDLIVQKKWTAARAESRRTLAYHRYAAERDDRKEAARIARRLLEGPPLAFGVADEFWDTLGDLEESDSSDESDSESAAIEDFLTG
ncbi:hypothetical protein P7C70_g9259, partial [Phenoliferia sp. Uapishka_3]